MGDEFPPEVTKELLKLSPAQRTFLADVVAKCIDFDAEDEPLFPPLTMTTYDAAPLDVHGVSKTTYDKILGMGFDLGRAFERLEHERPSD